MWSSETKLSCIKTELKRCTMIESLWNRYDISRKSPEVPVRRSPKVVRKDREVALNEPWDSTAIGCKNIRVCEARIFRLFTLFLYPR